MSIQDIILKIKGRIGEGSFRKTIEKSGFFVVMGLATANGFLLGRILTKNAQETKPEIEFQYPPMVSNNTPLFNAKRKTGDDALTKDANTSETKTPVTTQGPFAGSKTGKTYYPSACKALNRVKKENRVYFATQAEARSKGYSPSKSCSS